jgi:hypothetical protein
MSAQPSLSVSRKIFISYSHKDVRWLERLQIMLRPLIHSDQLTTWVDSQIIPGSEWFTEIQHALSSAKAAVLLVSPNFLASDFITKHELPHFLNEANKTGLSILWIAISASLYKETEIAKYKALNDPQRPLDKLTPSERNRVLVDICQQIKECANLRQLGV